MKKKTKKTDGSSDAERFCCRQHNGVHYFHWPPAEPPLTGVDPEVGFEVGRLAVHLPTARKRTAVSLLGRLLSRRRRRRPLVPGLFGCHRAPAVPGVQPATPPLHLLLRAGVAAPEASAASGADGVRVAFVQVQ